MFIIQDIHFFNEFDYIKINKNKSLTSSHFKEYLYENRKGRKSVPSTKND